MRPKLFRSPIVRWLFPGILLAIAPSAARPQEELPLRTGPDALLDACVAVRADIYDVHRYLLQTDVAPEITLNRAVAEARAAFEMTRQLPILEGVRDRRPYVRRGLLRVVEILAQCARIRETARPKALASALRSAERRLDTCVVGLVRMGAEPLTGLDNKDAVAVAAPIPSPAVIAVLTPGTGFTGATAQPATVGATTALGADAKAIARWNAVPWQTFSGDFEVGVLAFHRNGIDRVEFSANGGAWTPVTDTQLNPRTNTWEYCVKLRAADFADGQLEVRAIAWPRTAGIPRVLQGTLTNSQNTRNGNHSMFLSANSRGTLRTVSYYVSPTLGTDSTTTAGTATAPFRTPQFALKQAGALTGANNNDGTVINLLPGDYKWGDGIYLTANNSQRWVVLRPAPGVSRSQVKFKTSGFGYGMTLQCLENVTIEGNVKLNLGQTFIYLKDVVWVGPGPSVDSYLLAGTWAAMAWADGCEVSQCTHGLSGFTVQSNCYVHDVSFAAFQFPTMTVNCRASDYVSVPNIHADVWHWYPTGDASNMLENVVLYNVKVWKFDNQGLFVEGSTNGVAGTRMDNVAIVNVLIHKGNTQSAMGSWWNMSTNHLLMWHFSMPDQMLRWGFQARGGSVSNVSIMGSCFLTFVNPTNLRVNPLPPSSTVTHNHFVDPTVYGTFLVGTDLTSGNPGFRNPAAADFTPLASSRLVGRIPPTEKPVKNDLTATVRGPSTAVGPFTAVGE